MVLASETKLLVQEILKKVLDDDQKFFEDDFSLSELGIDSKSSDIVVTLLQEVIGTRFEVPLSILYDCPTVGSLTKFLEAKLKDPESVGVENDVRVKSFYANAVSTHPISIIGASCNIPFSNGSHIEYLNLLKIGAAIGSHVPNSRFLGNLEHAVIAGFLDCIQFFDNGFFSISESEARVMDPKQRLLLQSSYHAIKHASLLCSDVAKTLCAFCIGTWASDSPSIQESFSKTPSLIEIAGQSQAIAAGRLAYFYDAKGPALTIDTACSSSAVVCHLAKDMLGQQQIDLAICAAANLFTGVDIFNAFLRNGLLSPTGFCKAFDVAADGYMRSEAVTAVVMAAGDGLCNSLGYAIDSAMNQDGKGAGLLAPNTEAQIKVTLDATGSQCNQVEAHGTGTIVGDSVEFNSILRSHQQSGSHPLTIHSVKTLIGHTEACSGLAGVLRSIAFHAQITPHLHLSCLQGSMAQKDRMLMPFVEYNGSLSPYIGVNSFGLSGTNVHIVTESNPRLNIQLEPSPYLLLPLTAKSDEALSKLCSDIQIFLNHGEYCGSTLCQQVQHICEPFRKRTVAFAKHCESLLSDLQLKRRQSLVSCSSMNNTDVTMLFTGRGSAYPNMGHELFATSHIYNYSMLDATRNLGYSYNFLSDCSQKSNDSDIKSNTMLFCLEHAITELIHQLWGIVPASVLGHSFGEFCAAVAAGIMSMPDAVKLVTKRELIIHRMTCSGFMLVCDFSFEQAALVVDHYDAHVACLNSAVQTVLSVEKDATSDIQNLLAWSGFHANCIGSIPLHSNLMRNVVNQLRSLVQKISFHSPSIPFISSISGDFVTSAFNPNYWIAHLIEPVNFVTAVQSVENTNSKSFIEVGPKPVLLNIISNDVPSGGQLLQSLTPNQSNWLTLCRTLSELFCNGFPVNWQNCRRFGSSSLPQYEFSRKLHQDIDIVQQRWSSGVEPSDFIYSDRFLDDSSVNFLYLVVWEEINSDVSETELESVALVQTLTFQSSWFDLLASEFRAKDVDFELALNWQIVSSRNIIMPCEQQSNIVQLIFFVKKTILMQHTCEIRLLSSISHSMLFAHVVHPIVAFAQSFIHAVSREHSSLKFSLIRFSNVVDMGLVCQLLCSVPQGSFYIMVQQNKIFSMCIEEYSQCANTKQKPNLRTANSFRSVLITGGLGAIGFQSAKYLLEESPCTIVLSSRKSPDAQIQQEVSIMRCYGFGIGTGSQSTQRSDLLIQLFQRSQFNSIVHSAGVRHSSLTINLGVKGFVKVIEPKLYGAISLHSCSLHHCIDSFTMNSSVLSLFPIIGDAHYSAANAAIDALTYARINEGVHANCFNYGNFGNEGMAAGLESSFAHYGFSALESQVCIPYSFAIQNVQDGQILFASIDWSKMVEWRFDTLYLLSSRLREKQIRTQNIVKEEFIVTHVDARNMADVVETSVRKVLVLPNEEVVDRRQGFMEMGLDSLGIVELTELLQQELGTEFSLSSTILFDYPNVSALSQYIEKGLQRLPVSDVQFTSPVADVTSKQIYVIASCCKFGNSESSEEFRDFIKSGQDGVRSIPKNRWDNSNYFDKNNVSEGHIYINEACFLTSSIHHFDYQFFRISAFEAQYMDPQQRILLETLYIVYEGPTVDFESSKAATALYTGASGSEYLELARNIDEAHAYVTTGTASSMISGRIAYFFGFSREALTIDTACSSSLMAVKCAVEHMNSEPDISYSIATGVSLILSPQGFIDRCSARMFSPDSRCKTFDGDADGFGRGEGCGVVVLSQSQESSAYALLQICGCAANQDGASSGITAPNGAAQRIVIEKTLHNSNLNPSCVSGVETHGTGTSLGDPIEVNTLKTVYGQNKPQLLIGSVKVNIGHCEPAAGVAGFLKLLHTVSDHHCAMHRNFAILNNKLDMLEGIIVIPSEGLFVEHTEVYGAISSFGISGTNVHAIVCNTKISDEPETEETTITYPWYVIPVSGKTHVSLVKNMDSLLVFAETHNSNKTITDLVYQLACSKKHYQYRVGAVCNRIDELIEAKAKARDFAPFVGFPQCGFLFTGQGSEYVNMGHDLYHENSSFKEIFEHSNHLIEQHNKMLHSLASIVFPSEYFDYRKSSEMLHRTLFTQPLLFSLEVALFCQLKNWGVKLACAAGHSLGEVSAALATGLFDMEIATQLVGVRGMVMNESPSGCMFAVKALEGVVQKIVEKSDAEVWISAYNSYSETVVSCPSYTVDSIELLVHELGYRIKKINKMYAFHSPLMQDASRKFEKLLGHIDFTQTKDHLYSNVTGEELTNYSLSYWQKQMLEPVRFSSCIKSMLDVGTNAFIELGPSPILLPFVQQSLNSSNSLLLPTLHKKHNDYKNMFSSVGQLYSAGYDPSWLSIYSNLKSNVAYTLIPYSFDKKYCWLPDKSKRVTQAEKQHPLLGKKVSVNNHQIIFENSISLTNELNYLVDHNVSNNIVFPAAGFLEICVAAFHALNDTQFVPVEITDFVVAEPLYLQDSAEIETVCNLVGVGYSVEIYSSQNGKKSSHCFCTVQKCAIDFSERSDYSHELCSTTITEIIPKELYETFAHIGLHYGPTFQTIQCLLRKSMNHFSIKLRSVMDIESYYLHPSLCDGIFQSAAVPILLNSVLTQPLLMFGFQKIVIKSEKFSEIDLDLELISSSPNVICNCVGFSNDGQIVLKAEQIILRPLNEPNVDRLFYHLVWCEVDMKHMQNARHSCSIVSMNKFLCSKVTSSIQSVDIEAHRFSTTFLLKSLDVDRIAFLMCSNALAMITSLIFVGRFVVMHQDRFVNAWFLFDGFNAPIFYDHANNAGGVLGFMQCLAAEASRTEIVSAFASVERQNLERILKLVSIGSCVSRIVYMIKQKIFGQKFVSKGAAMFSCNQQVHSVVKKFSNVLITGGLAGVGFESAKFLAKEFGSQITLFGRSLPKCPIYNILEFMRQQNLCITTLCGDVASQKLLHSFNLLTYTDKIYHSAGVLQDSLVINTSLNVFRTVLRPKPIGALLLHACSKEQKIDNFVLYSAVSGLIGNPGQTNYAYANSALDNFAHMTLQHGHCVLSLSWGNWSQVGMAVKLEPFFEAQGLHAMSPYIGNKVLLEVLYQHFVGHCICINATWSTVLKSRSYLADFIEFVMEKRAPTQELREQLKPESLEFVGLDQKSSDKNSIIKELLRDVLGLSDASVIDADVGFMELGLDSLLAVKFHSMLQKAFGSQYSIPVTVAFDYPSVSALEDYLDSLTVSKTLTTSPVIKQDTELHTKIESHIAIISQGLQLPGGSTTWYQLQDSLTQAEDCVCDFPAGRWNIREINVLMKSDNMYVNKAAFVNKDIAQFDAIFFNISPKEASYMDPQQRFLLESCWHAFESCPLERSDINTHGTSVFVGCMNSEYSELIHSSAPLHSSDSTGANLSIISGRVAFFFGFEGAAMTINTACSSSLITLHLACQFMGMSASSDNLAVVAGVELMTNVKWLASRCVARMLSPEEHCKSFDKDANGYIRGEGCGVLFVQKSPTPMVSSLADVVGTNSNQDGRSSGLTAPNGNSQQKLLTAMFDSVSVNERRSVGVVEAHGTGTALGDPIEFNALARTINRTHAYASSISVGTIKANMGHCEGAAGVAALLKMMSSLSNSSIFPHRNWAVLNDKIDFNFHEICFPIEHTYWKVDHNSTISSFGVSGTNASALLSQSVVENYFHTSQSVNILPLSAKSLKSLVLLMNSWKIHLGSISEPMFDTAINYAAIKNMKFKHRFAVVADSIENAIEQLVDDLKKPSEALSFPLCILFSGAGQGSEYIGMGRQLADENELFRQRFESYLKSATGHNVQIGEFDFLTDDAIENKQLYETMKRGLGKISITQPIFFCIEYALWEMWNRWGLLPTYLLGHSTGELISLAVAGVFTPTNALKLISVRAKLMESAKGAMLALQVNDSQLLPLFSFFEELYVAGRNSKSQTVLSCSSEAVIPLWEVLRECSFKPKVVNSTYGFHSCLANEASDALLSAIDGMHFNTPETIVFSNLTGKQHNVIDAHYFCKQLISCVNFADCLSHIPDAAGFLEVGPHPVLSFLAQQNNLRHQTFEHSLNKRKSDLQCMLSSLASLYCAGLNPKWRDVVPSSEFYVSLPNYAFDTEQRYWLPDNSSMEHPLEKSLRLPIVDVSSENYEACFESFLDVADKELFYIHDHKVMNNIIVPAAAFLELMCSVVTTFSQFSLDELDVIDFVVISPLYLHSSARIETKCQKVNEQLFKCTISSQCSTDRLICHATCSFVWNGWKTLNLDFDFPPCMGNELNHDQTYKLLAEKGLNYGESLQTISNVSISHGSAHAYLKSGRKFYQHSMNPCLLDGIFQSFLFATLSYRLNAPLCIVAKLANLGVFNFGKMQSSL